MAVTKGHGADVVREASRAGLTVFGENRVAEAASKIETLRAELPALVWRLIGPLQSNKVAAALQYFSVVETVDRQRLVDRLERLLSEGSRRLPVLMELNLAGEASKTGADPADAESLGAAAAAAAHLELRGLMAVPPFASDPEDARPYFRRLRETRDLLAESLGRPLPELSMGMSHDFEIAVEEGSTEVRIGTALFGARSAP